MRTALITGTSSGFGLATTVELARRGWHVLATMRNLDKRAAIEDALGRATVSGRVSFARLDVTEPDAIARTVPELLSRADDGLDGVVHNAGVAIGGAFEDLAEADLRRVMETNFFGVLGLTRALLPALRARRGGRIVIVSSNSAFAGEPTNSIYCASKWAVEGWAESLAFEVEPFGISVSLIEPGPYRTSILANAPHVCPPDSAYAPLTKAVDAAFRKHFEKTARDPAEVARVIARALEAPRPRFRYPVGPEAHAGHHLRGKLPTRVLRAIVRRYLGLTGIKL